MVDMCECGGDVCVRWRCVCVVEMCVCGGDVCEVEMCVRWRCV